VIFYPRTARKKYDFVHLGFKSSNLNLGFVWEIRSNPQHFGLCLGCFWRAGLRPAKNNRDKGRNLRIRESKNYVFRFGLADLRWDLLGGFSHFMVKPGSSRICSDPTVPLSLFGVNGVQTQHRGGYAGARIAFQAPQWIFLRFAGPVFTGTSFGVSFAASLREMGQ